MPLSADGTTVAIGAPYNDGNGSSSGHVRVFQWVDQTWVQKGAEINGLEAGEFSGFSIDLSANGERLVIGAHGNDVLGFQTGQVRVYQWNGEDVDGDALTYSVTSPAHGHVTLHGALVSYTPEVGFSGTDSFNYKTNDGKVDSQSAAITITVERTSPVTSIEDELPLAKASVYPNPTTGPLKFFLPGTDPSIRMEVLSVSGEQIRVAQLSVPADRIIVTTIVDLPQGIYLITLSGKQAKKVFRVLKR